MKKKLVSMLLVCAMAASLLMGCCGSADGEGSSEGATLELFSTKAENVTVMQSLADKFNETHEGYTIEVVAPADAGTVLKTRMAKNDMPSRVRVSASRDSSENRQRHCP